MGVSESYRIYVLEQLQVAGPVTAKAMFGGVGIYQSGVFFGLIADDTLYLKVDGETRPEFEQAGSKPFHPYGQESYSLQYYEIPAEILEDRDALGAWVRKAVAAAGRSATARKNRPESS